jgi:hypothetical protein
MEFTLIDEVVNFKNQKTFRRRNMFLEGTANPGNIAPAINVVYALAPAFAIGFAVQRLLEILDTWVDLDKQMSSEWKIAFMSATALIVGLILALLFKIGILKTLDVNIDDSNRWLDYLVSGLIISAGTDGFNSILKFLSYSKDAKKTQMDAEKTTSISDRVFNRIKISESTNRVSTANTLASAMEGTIKEELKGALETRVKNDIGGQFDPANWDKTTFDILYQKLPPHLRLPGVANVLKESFKPILNDWGVPLSENQWKMYLSAIQLTSTPDFAIEFIGTI